MNTNAATTRCRDLWAVGFNDTARALEVRDKLAGLSQDQNDLILLDVAVAVRYRDGTFTLNGEPLVAAARPQTGSLAHFLASLALGVAPLTGSAVCSVLETAGVGSTACGISDDFVREVETLIKPGTSALFVLDEVGNLDPILFGIRGLGGKVLKTNVDLERATLIQSTLSS